METYYKELQTDFHFRFKLENPLDRKDLPQKGRGLQQILFHGRDVSTQNLVKKWIRIRLSQKRHLLLNETKMKRTLYKNKENQNKTKLRERCCNCKFLMRGLRTRKNRNCEKVVLIWKILARSSVHLSVICSTKSIWLVTTSSFKYLWKH